MKFEGTVGVVPIGVPLIVGPAVLTTFLVFTGNCGVIPTTASLILNHAIIWIAFEKTPTITKLFGKTGIAAISKVMALLLAAIAVMMIRLGIESFIK